MEPNDERKADAEERVNASEAALRAFIESKQYDPALRKTLIEEVNQAIADYLGLVHER